MLSLIKHIMADDGGASSAEYAILVAFVVAAVVAALAGYKSGLVTLFTDLTADMQALVNNNI